MIASAAAGNPVITPAIDLGPAPFAVVVAPDGKIAYVASGGVTPIRAATNTPLKSIKVGVGPTDVAITPDGKTVYVANDATPETTGNTVTPIRTSTNTAGKAIKVGSDPGPIAITPDGKTAYVVSAGSCMVTPIHVATNTKLKAIQLGCNPERSHPGRLRPRAGARGLENASEPMIDGVRERLVGIDDEPLRTSRGCRCPGGPDRR